MPNSPTSPFPLYLLPSISFRRRRSSATTTTTITTISPSSSPPQPSFLSGTPASYLRCHKCLTDLIPTSSIISKGFTGRHGRAYLVSPPPPSAVPASSLHIPAGDLPNTLTHKPVPRQLVTGAHTVSDISCRACGTVLGWKYVAAAEDSQRYKVGNFILETKRIVRSAEWDRLGEDDFAHKHAPDADRPANDSVEFDSQDEDECEDLFSGMWSEGLARRRRKNRESRFGMAL